MKDLKFKEYFKDLRLNEIQTQLKELLFNSNDNILVQAPTGSGKTILLEMALLKGVVEEKKIFYVCPLKSLCQEKFKYFVGKRLDVQLLTGDTDNTVAANVVVCTPEKLESFTRNTLFMEAVLLIDEIHSLGDRTALESLMTRLMTKTNCRIIGVSATFANLEDLSQWISRSSSQPTIAKTFNDSYRATQLTLIIEPFYYAKTGNIHVGVKLFEQRLLEKLPNFIRQHAPNGQILVFCLTRKSCETVNDYLKGKGFKSAYHHAKLSPEARQLVEQKFRTKQIQIVCATSTLSTGVNLPCNMSIIFNTDFQYKPTVSSIQQQLGRAGRKEHTDRGIGLIMTSYEEKHRIEREMCETQQVESALGQNIEKICEMIVVEISLGNISTKQHLITWLKNSFYYTRFKQKPEFYAFSSVGQLVNEIYNKCLPSLFSTDGQQLFPAPLSCILCKYFISISTLFHFRESINDAQYNSLLELACAASSDNVRIERGEKQKLNDLNKRVRFCLKGQVKAPKDKCWLCQGNVNLDVDIEELRHRVKIHLMVLLELAAYEKSAPVAIRTLQLIQSLNSGIFFDSNQLRQLSCFTTADIHVLMRNGYKTLSQVIEADIGKICMILAKSVQEYGYKLRQAFMEVPKFSLNSQIYTDGNESKLIINIDGDAISGFFLLVYSEELLLQYCHVTKQEVGQKRMIEFDLKNDQTDIVLLLATEDFIGCDQKSFVRNSESSTTHSDVSFEFILANLNESELISPPKVEWVADANNSNLLVPRIQNNLPTPPSIAKKPNGNQEDFTLSQTNEIVHPKRRLTSGEECAHKCKNKQTCRHACCKVKKQKTLSNNWLNSNVDDRPRIAVLEEKRNKEDQYEWCRDEEYVYRTKFNTLAEWFEKVGVSM